MSRLNLLLSAVVLLSLSACGDKDDSGDAGTPDCDGHGEFDADHGHCHCDDGYQLSDGGEGCIEGEGGDHEHEDDHDHDAAE